MLAIDPFGLRRPDRAHSFRSLFFNRVWISLSVLGLTIGMATGQTPLTLLFAMLLITAALGATWNRLALAGVEVERRLTHDRAFPDEVVEVILTVTNRKALPVAWVGLEEELSVDLEPLDRPTTVSGTSGRRSLFLQTRLGGYERVTWRIRIRCRQRGVQTIGPATLRASDPLGLFATRRLIDEETELVVYPRRVAIDRSRLTLSQPPGSVRAPRRLLEDPARIIGLRDYAAGDPLRSIHWKATARTGRMQVHVTESAMAMEVALYANLDTFEHYWEGLSLTTAEHVIEAVAAFATWTDHERIATSVVVNGVRGGSDRPLRIRAGSGVRHLQGVFEGLARLSPYSSVAFPPLLREETHAAPGRAVIVVMTSVMSDPLSDELRSLIQRRRRVVLFPIDDCPIPAIRGLEHGESLMGRSRRGQSPIPTAASV